MDDPAGRAHVVNLIASGQLAPDQDTVALPSGFTQLSDTGVVLALRAGEKWTLVFYADRGVLGGYTGWVHSSSGQLKETDALFSGRKPPKITRLGDHWFSVVVHR